MNEKNISDSIINDLITSQNMEMNECQNKLFGINIRRAREQRNISKERLAKMCDVSEDYIDEIEKNISEPTIKDLLTFSSCLNIEMSELLKKQELNVHVLVEEYIKEEVQSILENQGLDIQQVVELLFKKIFVSQKVPEELFLTNDDKETLLYEKVISESEVIKLDTKEKILEWLNEEE